MAYRITLMHPCGAQQVVYSLAEASLLVSLGWRFIAIRGRCFAEAFA